MLLLALCIGGILSIFHFEFNVNDVDRENNITTKPQSTQGFHDFFSICHEKLKNYDKALKYNLMVPAF